MKSFYDIPWYGKLLLLSLAIAWLYLKFGDIR